MHKSYILIHISFYEFSRTETCCPAIKFNDELKTYYQRKIAEGKNPMSVLNAVRFKLICRIFSVVKRNEEYQKEYKKIAA
jgi:hypothetical protein